MSQDIALSRQIYVKVDGAPLAREAMDVLFRVEVESSVALPAMCVLYLHDSGARLINEGPFGLGSALEVGVADEHGRGETTLMARLLASSRITARVPSLTSWYGPMIDHTGCIVAPLRAPIRT